MNTAQKKQYSKAHILKQKKVESQTTHSAD